ncbi:MAG: HD domain-containing protein, partial [Desulfobulbaceae bacterium]|nr:HD domain-containing protein [Desulfobulbaceae bacterium]
TPADHNFAIIDPLNGLKDLDRRIIRHSSNRSFTDDPLRMLRVFRFAAVFNFTIDESTINLVSCLNQMICKSAGERINSELEEIMATDRAASTFSDMETCGLLGEIIPQLELGRGMSQPESHHLDVLGHSMAALGSMEKILKGPERYFPPLTCAPLQEYLTAPKRRIELKWAALLHDIGKTTTRNIKNGTKITFYNHDVIGAQLIEDIARRLHWSNAGTRRITSLIHAHMRPFHLCNVARKGELSLKACIRLLKVIDADFPGLFLLAMADASACKGEESPATMKEEIGALLSRILEVYHNNILPVHSTAPILNGKDLIEIFHLEPGPIFSRLLEVVRLAHMEKTSMTKEEALILVQEYLKKHNRNNPER